MRKTIPLVAIVLAISFLLFGVCIDGSDAEEEDVPTQSELTSAFKSGLVDSVKDAIELAGYEEEISGEDIEISKEITVSGGSAYTLGHGNNYTFTEKGYIMVLSGGVLVLGKAFELENAVINLVPGSSIHFLNMKYDVTNNMAIVLKGSLVNDMDVHGNISATSVSTYISGTTELDGTLNIANETVKKLRLTFDFKLTAELNDESAIKDISKIDESVFKEENGITIEFTASNVKMSVDSTYLTLKFTTKDAAEVMFRSDLGGDYIELGYGNITSLNFDLQMHRTTTDIMYISITNLSKYSFSPLISVDNMVVKIEDLLDNVSGCSLNYSKFMFEISDNITMLFNEGSFKFSDGVLIGDVNIGVDANVSFENTVYYGNMTVEKKGEFSNNLIIPFKKSSSFTTNKVSVEFASDEPATMVINGSNDFDLKIYPYESRRLVPIEPGEYVPYEIDESGEFAIPKEKHGVYHVKTEQRKYTLHIDDTTQEVDAYSYVDLPMTEDIAGWTEGMHLYRDKVQMPAHDLSLRSIEASTDFTMQVDSGVMFVISEYWGIKITKAKITEILEMMKDNNTNTLHILVTGSTIIIDPSVLTGAKDYFILASSTCDSSEAPEYEKPIGDGMLYAYYMLDSQGTLNVNTTLLIGMTFSKMNEGDNTVAAYTMDEEGRLTKTESHSSLSGEIALVDATMSSFPYLVLKSDYVEPVGASRLLLLSTLIPIIGTAFILMYITKKR